MLNRAHDESREVVLSGGIHARHLGRLAADQGATVFLAATRDACYNVATNLGVKLAYRKVIEEEERLGALNGNVVYTMVDQIFANGIVATGRKSDFQLSANAIGRADQHRISPALERKARSETADRGQDAGGECRQRVTFD